MKLKNGQPIDIKALIDPEVVLHPAISSWREGLTVDLGLLNSLKAGQIQPIIFHRKDGKHELIAGARRYFHQKLLGTPWKDIPKDVRKKVTNRYALRMAAAENIFRKDFTPFEEARVIRSLIVEGGMKIKAVATDLSRSESYVRSRLSLLKLPEKVQKAFEKTGIPMSYATVALKLESEIAQMELVEQVEKGVINDQWGGIKTLEKAEEFVNLIKKQKEETEAFRKKWGVCPKCGSVNIGEGWSGNEKEHEIRCNECNHRWNGETKEPWTIYELKQRAREEGIEVIETEGKIELTPKDVAELMKQDEETRITEREREELESEPEIPENFRSKIPLEEIIIPLLKDNIQKVIVSGSDIDIELIEDTELRFKGLKKNYKAGEKARIETQGWNTQEMVKKVLNHIEKCKKHI